jgi:RimJ/RimL family protein N-acetyltransferase
MAKVFTDWLLLLPGNNKVITDPKPENIRAIACYKSAGFIEVGIVVAPDGAFLMERIK